MEDDAQTSTVVTALAGAIGASSNAETAPIVAGYDLVRVIGRGGMGIVWEALEHRLERRVALKVASTSASSVGDGVERLEMDVDALWTEALVAARIGDPSIVGVLDVGYAVDGRPYYAMDLVQGTDLAAVIADGPLAPRTALGIAADMARAAAAAHQHGVIHRDLKPRNVIIDPTGRARVCDFGIAFDVQRGADRYAGQIAGSPPYMAPEQALGQAITPQTDIWAIGVILYEMLTGRRPFAGRSTEDLLAEIVITEPMAPSSLREGIHGDLDDIVARCLMKAPGARFASASALFEVLSAIAEGRAVVVTRSLIPKRSHPPRASASLPPANKPRREDANKHLSWSWRLRASPSELWPFVADTDRFNKAVGLTPVVFTDETRPDGSVRRTGEIRVLGLHVSWREYPFEWIRDREHSVFRWYTSGPISALWNKVTLVPLPGGGTELHHDIWLSARGVIGRVAAFVELDRKLAPAVDRFYRHLDEVLAANDGGDPFEVAYVPTANQRAAVEAGCARLHADSFDAGLIERLAMHLLSAPTGVLGTLRPYEMADAWRTDRQETVDAFIHAAHIGILEPAWDVVCPKCLIAHESLTDLAHLTKDGYCAACATAFERDLRDSVELVFAPHQSVRSIERVMFCAGSPAKRPHVVAQQILEPGEERTITVNLPRGSYRVATAKSSWALVVSAVGFETVCQVAIEGDRVRGGPAIVMAGRVDVVLRNGNDVEETVRVELDGARQDAVTAVAALTHPSFRSLFPDQLIAQGEHLRVRHLAFVFVQLTSGEALCDAIGDSAACLELKRLEATVHEVAREHEGDVVPSALFVFAVGFSTSLAAVRAALDLRGRIVGAESPISISIAVHDGSCVALTRGGRPEFFGETLLRGKALLGGCPAGGVSLSATAMSDRDVAIAVHESGLSVAVDQVHDGPYMGRRVTLLLA